jgi:hypothetical protein
LGIRRGKGDIQENISKIPEKIKEKSENDNNIISHNGSIIGSLQDHNIF